MYSLNTHNINIILVTCTNGTRAPFRLSQFTNFISKSKQNHVTRDVGLPDRAGPGALRHAGHGAGFTAGAAGVAGCCKSYFVPRELR